jgi:hypothetical protein
MKLAVAAENPIERLLIALGIPPVILMDTHVSFMRARAIRDLEFGIAERIPNSAFQIPNCATDQCPAAVELSARHQSSVCRNPSSSETIGL